MQASDRTFGVEIECYLPQSVSITIGSYHRGLQVSWLPQGWNAQADGSLSAPMGYKAVEIVSPVLSGQEGIIQVVTVADKLAELGAVVNTNCGLHCHVGAADYTQVDVSKLVKLFQRYEPLFFSLNGQLAGMRWNNGYCKNSHHWQNLYSDRYQSLNLTNLSNSRRTVEFRLFAGTLNAEIIVQAVFMCVALVNKSKEIERVKTPLNPVTSITEMLTKFQRVIMTGQMVCDLNEGDDNMDITKTQAPLATLPL